jgi:parallel beta-helix repeat protein
MYNFRQVNGAWTGTVYIRANGSIDPPDAPIITHDNVTYFLNGSITSSGDGIVVERNNIVVEGEGYTVEGSMASDSKGIDLFGRSNVTIKNMTITKFYFGLRLYGSLNNTISGNNITNNQRGLWAVGALGNNISGNEITTNNEYGIRLEHSSENSVSGNNITADSYYGILVDNLSANNSISENKITGNAYGISLDSSSDNSISGNNITNNGRGISLSYSPRNNITENNVASNEYGIMLIGYSPDYTNRIYHNNFINNTNQAQVTAGYENVWDDGYPSGGNYWSDYTGVDLFSGPYQNVTGGDGIGDTPYIIDENNTDRYPLMYPYGTETFKLIITTATGGTTNPEPGTYIYPAGAELNVTAFPNAGYSFDYWLLDGNVRTENPITVIMDSNHTLETYFVDNIPPEISEPWQDPPVNNVQPLQNVTVWVNVTDYGTGIKNVTLWYSLDNGTSWTIRNMTALPIPSDTWITYEATIDGYENCTWVTYKIIAYDNAENNATKDNNGYGYQYHVIPEFPPTVILELFMTATLTSITYWKAKKKRQPPLNFLSFPTIFY